jgi:hypothetical protein
VNAQSVAFLVVACSLTAKVEVIEHGKQSQSCLGKDFAFFDELTRVQWMSTAASPQADDAFGEQERVQKIPHAYAVTRVTDFRCVTLRGGGFTQSQLPQ